MTANQNVYLMTFGGFFKLQKGCFIHTISEWNFQFQITVDRTLAHCSFKLKIETFNNYGNDLTADNKLQNILHSSIVILILVT